MDVGAYWGHLTTGFVIIFLTAYVNCCPNVCQCSVTEKQYFVDCSKQNLSSIPINFSTNTTQLDLSDNFITDLTSVFQNGTAVKKCISGLSQLQNLQSLSLSNNSLLSIQVLTLCNFSMLKRLDLSYNKISDIDDELFTGLFNLQHLDLHENRDLKITNKTFQYLTSLVELNLGNTGISPNNLRIPSNTQLLQLAGNDWEDFDAAIFKNMNDLISLDLSANNLSLNEDFAFPALESLSFLDLSRNNIRSIHPYFFNAMPNLHKLILDHNPISEVAGPVFQSILHLQYLSLSHMPNLYFLDKKTFNGLHSLSTLQLSDNKNLEFLHISLFSDIVNAKMINISYNNLSALHPTIFSTMFNVSIDIRGNFLPCDCNIEWTLEQNKSSIHVINVTQVSCFDDNKHIALVDLNLESLHCGEISVSTNTTNLQTKIGSSAILNCEWKGNPPPIVTWITPRGKKMVYFGSHALVGRSHFSVEDVKNHGIFHMDHPWHNSSSYQSDLVQYSDRIIILNDGSLFIDYMLRSDSGPYKCIVENSKNITSTEIFLLIDESILNDIMIWSILIGLACAASFFMLNLTYAVISALVRRCINQRRREAILKLVENIDQYKSAQLSRLKDNYYFQLNRIRDGYHNQLERIRENYSNQALRFRSGASQRKEWASNKLDTIRDNYNSQVTRLKENSAQKLEQLRETYNNQLLKIRDYGSAQMTRIHKKYKLQQRHVIKLLETMNFDNCRQIIDTECVRTESMIFETNLTHPELSIPSPSHSDSDLEYHTASSNNDTPMSSLVDLRPTAGEYLLTSHVTRINSSQSLQDSMVENHVIEINSVHSFREPLNSIEDNSSHLIRANSDDDVANENEMYDCEEIDQMLVQIQLIDESDDESNENSPNAETCV